jgi:hypothetical protein
LCVITARIEEKMYYLTTDGLNTVGRMRELIAPEGKYAPNEVMR